MLPTLVACIVGFVYIQWGYQANMVCVELFIIEVIMLVLMVYEKLKLKSYALKHHQYL